MLDGHARGEVLAFRRAPHKHHGGLWEFPGGKVEPGEAPADALARELREELGVEVTVGRLLWAGTSDAPALRITFFEVVADAGRLVLGPDHDAVRSVGPEGAGAALAWAPVDRAFVQWWSVRGA